MINLFANKSPSRRLRHYALIACLMAGLSSCGQKGPLYLPEPEPETERTHKTR